MRPLIAILCIVPLAACQQQIDSAPVVSRGPAIQALGPAERCISVNRIDTTRVHDDYTIDFEMIDNTTYRNTLPNRCPSLGFEERFSYNATTGQLCSVDTIRVRYSDGQEGASCGLGEFLPVRINKPGAD
ncbi:hypothetical protein [Tsuneonella sp. HG222]